MRPLECPGRALHAGLWDGRCGEFCPVQCPGDSTGKVEAGIEASAARWSAMGEYFARMKALAADAARWNALGESFTPDYGTIAAVSSARYSALGDLYRGKIEAGIEASSARWSALGESLSLPKGRAADAARWSALGEQLRTRL